MSSFELRARSRNQISARPRWVLIAIAVCCCALAACQKSPRSLTEASAALDKGEIATVERDIEQALAQDRGHTDWQILGVRSAILQGDLRKTQEKLQQFSRPVPRESASSLTTLGRSLIQLGHVTAAETALTLASEADPRGLPAHVELAYLLGVEGRCFEAAPHLFESVRQGQFTPHHLVLLGAADPVIDDPAFVERAMKADPGSLLPRLGVARTALRQDDIDTARVILKTLVSQRPDLGEVQGQWGPRPAPQQ